MNYYGIIGYPLMQSFSPAYFKQKFAEEKIIDTDYLSFPITKIEQFTTLIKDNPQLKGLNVTIPYKESIVPYANTITDVVRICGAANCLKIEQESITAYNTDVIGFEKSLKPLLQTQHTHALILGTGGAAKGVAYVLNQLNINFLFVSRTKKNAATIAYEELDEKIMELYTLVINASPSGMFPHIDKCPPIPYAFLNSRHLLYDLIYNPPETIFLQKGKQMGAAIKNGYEMLVLQAEASWDIWNSK